MATNQACPKILIVDDHALVRKALSELFRLELGIETVMEASGFSQALNVMERHVPALVIIDVQLADRSGIELAQTIRTIWPDTKTLFLSASEDPFVIASALRAGASGYVLKGAGTQELTACVREIISGRELSAPPSTTRIVIEEMRSRQALDQMLRSLTPSERRVVELQTAGLTSGQIATRLGITAKTVRNTSSSARRKLAANAASSDEEHVA
ncbi:MAG: response regulator transcription factor [Actinomycetota bacterium]